MFERELTSSESLLNIIHTIHALGLNPVARYADSAKLVATADLFDKHNNLIESGAGKGPNAIVGALAESIEHFSILHSNTNILTWQRSDHIATQIPVKNDGYLINLPLTEELIACLQLKTLDNSKTLFIPQILLCPNAIGSNLNNSTAVQFLNRYSSNSGIAFGCTKAEALLHGVHEVIERHILSRFFMTICEIGPKIELYSPSRELLGKALQHNPVALECADKLQVIVIKEMSVYFSVAFPTDGPGDQHLSPIGSGCSLDVCTAIQRAVTEQFQSKTLYDADEEQVDRKTFDLLSHSKNLKNLIDFAPIKTYSSPLLTTQDHPLPLLSTNN